ncbi:MAG: bifunctional folylpolyglutamate synthase/dihydrofolate synthase [Alphaproteobacteria bacterium]|nr:bifunctional folylpolyglutamate synthase/dihydrofolate synthase [Alphaproteobacteria bacterium]
MTAAEASDAILQRLLSLHPKRIDLVLDRVQRLLDRLGHPERRIPPVIHVAGTNGKGSICAFLRAMLEGSGYSVHVYTSPHLVHFHERIRIAGRLISEEELSATLEECEIANASEPITFFEITTAAAFLAFSRHRADLSILEVGLGGRFDATNVIDPLAACITPVALDHQEFLGDSLAAIATEKAGIIKAGRQVILGPQDDEAKAVLMRRADQLGAPLYVFGEDFSGFAEHGRLVYQDSDGLLDLPPPKLPGRHQLANAATAIAALRRIGGRYAAESGIEWGLKNVEWPARMQRLTRGPLIDAAPEGAEVWLDGGHNPHGGAVVAQTMADFEERAPKPLYVICGMLKTKDAVGYLLPFRGIAKHATTIAIAGEQASLGAGALYDAARMAGLEASPADDLLDAMMQVSAWARARESEGSPRILICGSLYLAGQVLRDNS